MNGLPIMTEAQLEAERDALREQTGAQPLTAERIAEIERIAQDANCSYPGTREGFLALREAQDEFLEKGTEAIADLLCEVERLRAELDAANAAGEKLAGDLATVSGALDIVNAELDAAKQRIDTLEHMAEGFPEAVEQALKARPAPVVPAGWKMVPVKPDIGAFEINDAAWAFLDASPPDLDLSAHAIGRTWLKAALGVAIEKYVTGSPPAPLLTEAEVRADERGKALRWAAHKIEGVAADCERKIDQDCYFDLANEFLAEADRRAAERRNAALTPGLAGQMVEALEKAHEHMHQLTAIIPHNDQAYPLTTDLMANIRAILARIGKAGE